VKDFSIHIDDSVKEIVIREGKALDPVSPVQVHLQGDITTPSVYFIVRQHTLDLDKVVVIFNNEKKRITLLCDPSDSLAASVVGDIEDAKELQQFSINGQKTFSREELVKLIRFNRRFFASRDEAELFYTKLSNFSISANIENRQSSDMRGNKGSHHDKFVKTDLPSTVKFALPIFKNSKTVEFLADVCVDVSETQARFWFESIELDSLLKEEVEAFFSTQKQFFTEAGIVVVNQ
jgi:hypothetical protein